MRPLISDKDADGWAEAYAYKAKIEAAEAERNKPMPTFTMKALLAWSAVWATVAYLAGWMAS